MSGFLQRLASRALGRPPAIRPMIVGSYAPALRAEPIPNAEQPPEETALLLPQGAAETGQRTATRQAPQAAADPVPSGEPREREALPVPPRVGKPRIESPAEQHAGISRDRPQPTGSTAAAQVLPRADDDRLLPTDGYEDVSSPRARLVDSPDAVPARSDASDSDPAVRHSGAAAPSQLVRASVRSPFTPERARRHMPQMLAAVEHDAENITEVHVTIGRIELTAAPAPAPASPRRGPVARRKAQSLEEYLARREANRS